MPFIPLTGWLACLVAGLSVVFIVWVLFFHE